MNSLRILLQNRETKAFYMGSRQWTNDDQAAMEFSGVLLAFAVASHYGIDQMEIVFHRRSGPRQHKTKSSSYSSIADAVSTQL